MTTHPFAEIVDLLSIVPEGNEEAVDAVRMHDAQLTKPPGSLGRLEELVEWLARWQGKRPTLDNRWSRSSPAITASRTRASAPSRARSRAQMVANFTAGGAAISQICALHELQLRVFELALELPTGDITLDRRMDDKTCAATIAYRHGGDRRRTDLPRHRRDGHRQHHRRRGDLAALYGGTGADWVGRGTGVDDAGLERKADAVDARWRCTPIPHRSARRSSPASAAARSRRCWARWSPPASRTSR